MSDINVDNTAKTSMPEVKTNKPIPKATSSKSEKKTLAIQKKTAGNLKKGNFIKVNKTIAKKDTTGSKVTLKKNVKKVGLKTLQKDALKPGKTSNSNNTSKSKPSLKIEDKLDINQVISQKFKNIMTKNEKKKVRGRSVSTLADLVKFNTSLASSFYKVNDQDCLEVSLLALESPEAIQKMELSPRVSDAWKEVSLFRDLLLLGDLPTITQEQRPYEWIYSAPKMTEMAQTALMTCFLSLTMKLTGKRPARLNMKIPGGKLTGKGRDEVVSYLSIMQTVAESMAEGNNYQKSAKFNQLNKMKNDLIKIINDF